MCLAVCGKIKNVEPPFASIDIKGIEACVNIDLIDNPAKGDYVLVHAGFAIQKIDEEYFNYLENILDEMLREEYG
ncbi:HypC/HybG/HupF family hydrogenase formation chaperone [uncultured Clostridium sp.]|uniref:HypC/HybG/HupF family hydrogenase formation chaperone n=1 Tax=uncultured Clostridium sp. TaxID=59620 RepID=UPI0028E18CC9|nr:HypC/HybG/HupF family hydrogenase formation chaperone [uncultured Clostridium sp.]